MVNRSIKINSYVQNGKADTGTCCCYAAELHFCSNRYRETASCAGCKSKWYIHPTTISSFSCLYLTSISGIPTLIYNCAKLPAICTNVNSRNPLQNLGSGQWGKLLGND